MVRGRDCVLIRRTGEDVVRHHTLGARYLSAGGSLQQTLGFIQRPGVAKAPELSIPAIATSTQKLENPECGRGWTYSAHFHRRTERISRGRASPHPEADASCSPPASHLRLEADSFGFLRRPALDPKQRIDQLLCDSRFSRIGPGHVADHDVGPAMLLL
jgi:hypothetical protein